MLLLLSVVLLGLQQPAFSQSAPPADALGHRCPPLPPGLASIDSSGDWAIRTRLGDHTPPAYTEQDARDYIKRHGPWELATGAPPPHIVSIRFMTARPACVETGSPMRRPDDALVCLVTLRGRFAFASPPSVRAIGNTEYLTFDVTTGNLIGIMLTGH
ncbi:MAG TPA: hypothetical protein VHA53_04125 [Nitrolancea sp.]|nr:hypothetical protein [Nitrolancea sp.]